MAYILKLISFCFILGLFLVPISLHACKKEINNKKIEIKNLKVKKVHIVATFSKLESSCDDGTCKGECCNKKPKGCGHEDCDGNCNATSCFTSISLLGFLPLSQEKQNSESFSFLKNHRFSYKNSFYSFGFHSIWQPPKIG
ncbi:hypothetical protein [Frigoriflavimonas asaccharolytica]|uniref:hypothetical protein n=1 Tax=Frigoriflavimonas asaccharolytica TaxID=2735899 RepID=UPI0036D21638